MGTSVNAILACGYAWEETLSDLIDNFEDVDEEGLCLWERIDNKFPLIELSFHGIDGMPYPILFIKRSLVEAYAGSPKYHRLGVFIPTEEELKQLDAALNYMHITEPPVSSPRMFLTAWMG